LLYSTTGARVGQRTGGHPRDGHAETPKRCAAGSMPPIKLGCVEHRTAARSRCVRRSVRMLELRRLLAEHLTTPFPFGVVKGRDYGSVDAVMIGADIYGWASRVAEGELLTSVDRDRPRLARDDLVRSMAAFPEAARPYYEQLVRIATAALN
jgi:hypothetical protein